MADLPPSPGVDAKQSPKCIRNSYSEDDRL